MIDECARGVTVGIQQALGAAGATFGGGSYIERCCENLVSTLRLSHAQLPRFFFKHGVFNFAHDVDQIDRRG